MCKWVSNVKSKIKDFATHDSVLKIDGTVHGVLDLAMYPSPDSLNLCVILCMTCVSCVLCKKEELYILSKWRIVCFVESELWSGNNTVPSIDR